MMQKKHYQKLSKNELIKELHELHEQIETLTHSNNLIFNDGKNTEFNSDKFQSIIKHAGDAIYLSDLEGNIKMTNSHASKMLFYSKEELLTMKVGDLDLYHVTLDDQKLFWSTLTPNESQTLESIHIRKDGTHIPVEIRVALLDVDDTNYVLGFARDISERKKAEQQIEEKDRKFKLFMQQAPFVVEIYNMDGLQTEVNHAYETLWGFPASTTLNTFNVLKSKEVEESGLLAFIKKAYEGESLSIPEYQFDPKGETEAKGKGRIRWLSTRIFPLKDKDDKVINIVIVHQDVSERREALENLRLSEKRFKNLVQHVPFPLCNVNNETGEIKLINNRFQETFGYTVEDIPNVSDWWIRAYPDESYREWVVKNWNLAIEFAKQNNTDIRPASYQVCCKNNEIKHLVISGILIGDDSLVTFVDVTAQKLAEDELNQHKENLESIVKERTKNLEDKNNQLRRFSDLFVDREFRIKELRDEIERLNSK